MIEHDQPKEEPETQARNIVVPLQVAFGILITSLVVCAGGFGTSIWWASSVSTKLELLVKQGTVQEASSLAMGTRLTALELWQRQVDAVGTPTMAKGVSDLKSSLEQLREEFNLHRATTTPKP